MTVRSSVAAARRVRHLVRTRVSEMPALYLPFARRKYPGPSPEVIGSETEFVIDGYTRSACTFAVYAFQLAQPRPVRMAHHLHAPAQLIAAAKLGVPALVVIREPQGAVLSQLVREPDVDLRDALVAYARFYSCLLPHRSSFVAGEFEEVTGDFGSVIRRVNERFGTTYAEFEHTEGHVRECFDLIRERPTLSPTLLGFESGVVTLGELRQARARVARPSGPTPGDEVWVPSADREERKRSLRAQWFAAGLTELRTRAQRVYQGFLASERNRSREVR
jgi:hypothetical protein